MDGRGIEVVVVKQKNDCRRALNYEDRLRLSRQIEQVRPLIDLSRGNRIARHPIGELRMVEWRFRMNWA
jgi:hypothetical protein